ncbi:hypothetical protein PR048_029810 [Dryococelus australis]|uniref:HTH psq-type domain-containing protein n=1 Tax=Dryococelus australis TaxID=614101 RepID=A0ABQ9G766_9NEOP|nr:hypothetical protein PR048_029810 [Dryococelus australis]
MSDLRNVFFVCRAKPRLSALSGRRTYTEEELQAALRDIQSGKLGTRRAAVIYGIPRSTLRNKVYKLAMEREREIHLVPADVFKVEDEEKELSGAEEEQEVEKVLRKPLLSMEDLVRFSMLENNSLPPPDALRALLHCQEDGDGSISPPSLFSSFPRDGWGGMEHSTLGPYISQLLTASPLGNRLVHRDGSPIDIPNFPNPLLPEIVRRMMAEEKLLINEQLKKQAGSGMTLNPNGAQYQNDERKKMKTEMSMRPEGIFQEEEKTMDVDTSTTASGTATPPNVILKIPSFKPTSKNGVASSSSGSVEPLFSEQFPSNGNRSPGITQESSQHMSSSNSCSPPITNLIGKGIGVSLRDVIAKSISQKFQQGTDNISPLSHPQQKFLAPNGFDQSSFIRNDFISPLTSSCSPVAGSVIKNHYNNNNSSIHEDRNTHRLSSHKHPVSSGATMGTTTTGGKGTRPKRGKYRNYDRDSLVEAVRAVQRGEMSVHRAGSYYGVPHSTLEYKVKERHLMRPRKREPKVQLDEAKIKDDVLRISSPEKSKLQSKPINPPFPATSPLTNTPNGMVKMQQLFDPNLPLGYPTTPPFPFWPSNPFHSLPIPEFPRGVGPPASFSSTPEQFFAASQMMQRLQEDSSRIHHSSNSPGTTTSHNTSPPGVPTGALGKNAREIAESLYDGSGANGSFLDGIIRSSLEMGLPVIIPRNSGVCSESVMAPENMSNKALLDQLCRNSHLPPLSHPPVDGSSSDDDSIKRVCGNKCQKTDSGEGTSAIVDLGSLATNSSAIHGKLPVNEDSNKCVKAPSPEGNTKNSLIESVENLKPPSTETNGINDNCGTAEDESACDSKSSVLRVDSNDSAKEEEQGEETEEKTKSKMINSPRD